MQRAVRPSNVPVQIIVIENKQPPPGVTEGLHYIQFVGDGVPGRAGFFPAAPASM